MYLAFRGNRIVGCDEIIVLIGLHRHDGAVAPGMTAAYIVNNIRHYRPAYELRQQWSYNNLVCESIFLLQHELSSM